MKQQTGLKNGDRVWVCYPGKKPQVGLIATSVANDMRRETVEYPDGDHGYVYAKYIVKDRYAELAYTELMQPVEHETGKLGRLKKYHNYWQNGGDNGPTGHGADICASDADPGL